MRGTRQSSRIAAVAAAGAVALTLVAWPARSGEEFVLGSGDVKSQFLAVSPETAGLSVGVVVGETLADYSNDVARAQSRAVNMGVIGVTATAEKCDGDPPDLHKENLPTTVRVDSRQAGAAEGRTDYWPILPRDLPYQFDDAKEENGGLPNLDPPPDSPARSNVSRLHARASGQPSAFSTSDTGATNVAGVADVAGGHTSTGTRIEGGKRIAEAIATIPELSLGGGAVVFRDLEWRAAQTTGAAAPADVTYEASFRLGTVTIGDASFGWPEPAGAELQQQVSALTNLVNTALAPTGLVVAFPTASQAGDHATISSLDVRVERPPLGRELFALLPPEVYEARREVFDRLLEADCNFATYISVADITLATPSGAGTTRVSFGGADAFTEGTRFANPFAVRARPGGTPFVAPVGAGEVAVEGEQVVNLNADASPHVSPLPAAPGGGFGGAGGLTAGAITAPGSKSASAAIVGAIGLIAVLSVALMDFMKPRRVLAEDRG